MSYEEYRRAVIAALIAAARWSPPEAALVARNVRELQLNGLSPEQAADELLEDEHWPHT